MIVPGDEDRLLASLVRSVADYAIVALDVEGRVCTWNPGAERLFGHGRDEVLGRHVAVFHPQVDLDAGRPDWALAVAAADGAFEEEGWRVRRDGTIFWASVLLTAVRDDGGRLTGFGQIVRDLTERKRGEDALRDSEERFSLLVGSVADYAIFLLHPDGTIASWNLGAERLKGYRPDEIIGRHLSTFYTEGDRRNGVPERGLASAFEVGRWRSEGWRVRKDGSRFWAEVVITSLRGRDGTHRGFAKVTRDLTDRKRNEDALRGVLDRERDTADRLRELDRLKTDFIAVVAHDLRAPVGVAQSLLQMAVEEWDATAEPDRRELVARARHRIDRLATFVDDVFDAARLETGELQVAAETFDVRALVDHVAADATVTAPKHRIEVSGSSPATVVGDPQRTWQVLVNVVSNAVKFSPPGSTVRVEVTEVPDDGVRILVADEGPGIAADQQELLFRRFSRLPSSATTPGAGLGLFIARSLTEAQHGTLELLDTPQGSGATFRLVLPGPGGPA